MKMLLVMVVYVVVLSCVFKVAPLVAAGIFIVSLIYAINDVWN